MVAAVTPDAAAGYDAAIASTATSADQFLAGYSAAVTGAGQGIGRSIALRLAAAGARVAVGDIDRAAADSVAAEIGPAALADELDVADFERFDRFLTLSEERHGPLDVLVNNAGVDWVGPFHAEPDEVTRREIAINLYGTTLGTKLALTRMLPRQRGHIVNIASGVGRIPLPGSATYSATKHGIVGLTESLRMEYRGQGVEFTVVQPSQVQTAMIEGQPQPALLPLVRPDDVAAAVLDALRRKRFDVWVPRSQGASVRLSAILPRSVRDAILRRLGVTRIAGEADLERRRAYHRRAFGRE